MSDKDGKSKFNLSLDQALNNIKNPSIFDELIKKVNATLIPTKYISYIIVYYKDGRQVTIDKESIDHPIPIKSPKSWKDLGNQFEDVKDMKVYIDTALLEHDTNEYINRLFKHHGIKNRNA